MLRRRNDAPTAVLDAALADVKMNARFAGFRAWPFTPTTNKSH
jgi:hypothetical protein